MKVSTCHALDRIFFSPLAKSMWLSGIVQFWSLSKGGNCLRYHPLSLPTVCSVIKCLTFSQTCQDYAYEYWIDLPKAVCETNVFKKKCREK